MHPYGIQRNIRQRYKHEVINVSQRAALYQAIRRLEREGLIRASTVTRAANRPERTTYELTDSGRATVDAWLRDGLARPLREYPEFPAVLSFLDHLTPEIARVELARRLAALDAEEVRLTDGYEAARRHNVPRIFLIENEYLRTVARAERAWVAALIADLDAGTLAWSPDLIQTLRAAIHSTTGADEVAEPPA